ncbi:MAG: phosphoribosyl-ATP diphosphatase [Rhodospirillales bacterium]|nr:phosphoribosyl-ATP diphosphatase [Rhodospirillales bacterium]
MNGEATTAKTLADLYAVIESRRGGDPEESYTAKMFAGGLGAITRKVGEESLEVIIAALRETPEHVVSESADLLYHLLILWVEQGIKLEDIFDELESRSGTSGIEEKNSRTPEELSDE